MFNRPPSHEIPDTAEHGKGAGLVLPRCNTQAMSLHLAEISLAVAPGAHAVLLMDQAGWHTTDKLVIPANIHIVPLPAKGLSRLCLCYHIWYP